MNLAELPQFTCSSFESLYSDYDIYRLNLLNQLQFVDDDDLPPLIKFLETQLTSQRAKFSQFLPKTKAPKHGRVTFVDEREVPRISSAEASANYGIFKVEQDQDIGPAVMAHQEKIGRINSERFNQLGHFVKSTTIFNHRPGISDGLTRFEQLCESDGLRLYKDGHLNRRALVKVFKPVSYISPASWKNFSEEEKSQILQEAGTLIPRERVLSHLKEKFLVPDADGHTEVLDAFEETLLLGKTEDEIEEILGAKASKRKTLDSIIKEIQNFSPAEAWKKYEAFLKTEDQSLEFPADYPETVEEASDSDLEDADDVDFVQVHKQISRTQKDIFWPIGDTLPFSDELEMDHPFIGLIQQCLRILMGPESTDPVEQEIQKLDRETGSITHRCVTMKSSLHWLRWRIWSSGIKSVFPTAYFELMELTFFAQDLRGSTLSDTIHDGLERISGEFRHHPSQRVMVKTHKGPIDCDPEIPRFWKTYPTAQWLAKEISILRKAFLNGEVNPRMPIFPRKSERTGREFLVDSITVLRDRLEERLRNLNSEIRDLLRKKQISFSDQMIGATFDVKVRNHTGNVAFTLRNAMFRIRQEFPFLVLATIGWDNVKKSPIVLDVNRASREELAKLPGIKPEHIGLIYKANVTKVQILALDQHYWRWFANNFRVVNHVVRNIVKASKLQGADKRKLSEQIRSVLFQKKVQFESTGESFEILPEDLRVCWNVWKAYQPQKLV